MGLSDKEGCKAALEKTRGDVNAAVEHLLANM